MLNSFKIGNYTDSELGTGVTVVLAVDGAVGGVSVRGSAPATRETDLLRCGNSVEKANAVILSGGSAFGLESACGAVKYLGERNIGYHTSARNVPIVCAASLYDLEYKSSEFPDSQCGYKACEMAKEDNFEYGNIGAGTGATVGKILGANSSAKGGLGIATITCGKVEMACIVAVNAFGNIYDYKTGKLVKGANIQGQNIDIIEAIKHTDLKNANGNTTLGVVITNAKLTKEQANKLADIAHDGYAMTIRPTHTMVDGDVIFALASGEEECDFMLLSCIAPTLMADAILNATKEN